MMLRLLACLAVVGLASIVSAVPVNSSSQAGTFLSCLSSQPSLNLATWHKDCREFTNLTAAFNQRLYSSASAVVSPQDANAVAAAVTCAQKFNRPVTARGGGHSYAGYGIGSGLDAGLVVYLSNLQNIELKEDNVTVVVGGGALLGDIALQLNEWGLAMAHGTKWGLTLDAISAFDIVLANGTYVQGLTREQDPDLFWALSGAAPNYGIVTAYHFVAHQKPTNVVQFDYGFSGLSPAAMTQAFLAFQAWGKNSSPPELGIQAVIGANGSLDLSGLYYGSGENFTNLMDPFVASLPSGVSPAINYTMSWIDSLVVAAQGQALSSKGQQDTRDCFYAKSLMTPDSDQLITEEAANAFFSYLQNTETTTQWFVEIDLYGGAGSYINSVPLNQSSFAHRSSLLTFQMYASSPTLNNPFPDYGFSYVDGMYNALVEPMKAAWSTTYGSYVNYIDPMLSPSEVKALYWSSQYDRLSQLRAKYDPDQTLWNPQAIQPTVSSVASRPAQ
ncbi:BZ3500_MvSof-1268-A1-R1_Chr10-2g02924 [Microbotryum saponariae]|uniref:BZ3500_MvSof-1268-A1-R1_Chr10-2g02924 protein n=1 Tax=Microbotryum saponariae TaxID=289078 RepID=A0A2X0K758_9BASI|nr:BZ3501_MvSof-1269-A2-R1_Chr10-2g02510 [Microbotryum saponariae]SDA01754.1 BZ3500_MvSof-1268-A1-R1_Chr10-2g02924 [Microbotryum saponariae]